MARHDDMMPQVLLAQLVKQLLHDDGLFCVMYPAAEWNSWMSDAAATGLHLVLQLSVRPKNDQHSNRQIGIFHKGSVAAVHKDELVIYEADGSYSKQFVALMKDYYLNL